MSITKIFETLASLMSIQPKLVLNWVCSIRLQIHLATQADIKLPMKFRHLPRIQDFPGKTIRPVLWCLVPIRNLYGQLWLYFNKHSINNKVMEIYLIVKCSCYRCLKLPWSLFLKHTKEKWYKNGQIAIKLQLFCMICEFRVHVIVEPSFIDNQEMLCILYFSISETNEV